jgi:starvation-inducible DNA-binding protein
MNATVVSNMHTTRIDLPDRTRIEMIDLLNRRLAESLDLALQARHAHWNVRGRQFMSLHDLFARLYSDLDAFADLLAERVVQLGGLAEGTIEAVADRSDLPRYGDSREGVDHTRSITAALASWSSVVRSSIRSATELNDPVTVDILTEVARGVDKWLWLVDAHLAKS